MLLSGTSRLLLSALENRPVSRDYVDSAHYIYILDNATEARSAPSLGATALLKAQPLGD